MISRSCFIEDFLRVGQKFHKIVHNSIKNRGSTPILTNLVVAHPRNIHTKFETNSCSGLRKEVQKSKKGHDKKKTITMDTG